MTNINSNNQSIQLVPYRDLDDWDSSSYFIGKIRSNFPVVKLGMFLQEENHKQSLNDFPEEEFGILGINNKDGIFDAYQEKGKNIQQSYKRMEVGWLAYNPYRVNVGSIGIRTTEHRYNFISPAYIVFSCLPEIIPEYLCLLFKTHPISKAINESATDAVRPILAYNSLKKLTIPLPPKEMQGKLLSIYTSKISRAERKEKEAIDKEQEADSYLLMKLGINLPEVVENRAIRLISFQLLNHWDTDLLMKPTILQTLSACRYPVQSLRNFLTFIQYGSSFKALTESTGVPLLRMNNIINGDLDITELKYIPATQAKEEGVLLDKGDLLFNRTNSKELVGKTAVFDLEEDYAFASYLIRLKLDKERVNVHYINYLFNSPLLRMQIDQFSRQSIGQANINSQELQNFLFPIPDKMIQDEIANEISTTRKNCHILKTEAKQIREEALEEFERTVFKL